MQKVFKSYWFVLWSIFAMFIFDACSTDKNTIVHRTFHNITARYNGYHYARESIKEGANKLNKSYKDDYTRILNIYKIGDEVTAKTIFPEMEKAYKKTSAVIQRHSIFLRGTEYCKWIDDNYLLIGISHYYKRDFFAALEIFEYITNQYKKEEIRYDAMVWTLRTYNEAAIVSKALTLIEQIENDKKFPERLKSDFNIALADFYLKQEKYQKAIEALKKVVDKKFYQININKENYAQYFQIDHAPRLIKKTEQKSRLMFILAQLYQKQYDNQNAFLYFGKVIKSNPAYEMTFQAKMNQARTFDVNAKKKRNIKTELLNMLEDSKNSDYFDQIYFSLAEIYFKENDIEKALINLKKSIETNVNNPKQKAFSFLRLAEHYFKSSDYINSFNYYDSALASLPKDYADFDKIEDKKRSLNKVVKNLNIIEKEDSLQKIAAMSESERNSFIDKVMEEIEQKEKEKKKQEEEKKQSLNNNISANSINSKNTAGTGSMWYFYNNSSVSMGYAEFTKKWGDRKLEDNWRRKNKESLIIKDEEKEGLSSDNSDSLSSKESNNKMEMMKKNFIKELPLSSEKLKKSTENLIEAYYNLGTIYKEELNDYKNSIEAFENLNKKIQDHQYLLQVYYQLYRSNLHINQNERAEYYKNILLEKYPESPYSKLIKNPDYAKETMASLNEIENLYAQTYESHIKGLSAQVIRNCSTAREKFAKSTLMPKFELLNAMAIGKTSGIQEFESELKTIIIKYPQDPVKNKAEELLNQIQHFKKSNNPIEKENAKKPIYTYQADAMQNCLIIYPKNNKGDSLLALVDVFNKSNFEADNYTVKKLPFNEQSELIIVSAFKDATAGLNYLNSIIKNETLIGLAGSNTNYTLVSDNNLGNFLQEKKPEEYLKFFKESYPQ